MRRGAVDPDADHKVHRDLARRIDPRAFLEHYHAENAYDQTSPDGTIEVIHSCLIDRVDPHHANGDQNPSASCNVDKGLYVCYSYSDPDPDPRYYGKSGMDLVRLAMKLEGKTSVNDVSDTLAPILSGAAPDADGIAARIKKIRERGDPTGGGVRRPQPQAQSIRVLESWAFVHPYLEERGVDLDTASEMHIGFDPDENRITIPHFWHGALVGWQKRAIPDRPGQWVGTRNPVPKYRNSPGFPKSTTLYCYDHAKAASPGRVIVVESPFSVIKARSLGIDNVVSTFGAKITDEQVDLLRDWREVIVWMDDDDAGEGAIRKTFSGLRRHIHARFVASDPDKDLGDYDTADEIHAKIEQAIEPPTMLRFL